MTESLKDKFEQDGYVIARNVLDADLIAEASDHVDWLIEKKSKFAPRKSRPHAAAR